jgi:DNA-binding transcriptional LysR family regulator
MLEWDSLRLVLAVAESGSVSGAARRLRLSQPTVSRRIADLERRLSTRLFDRRGRALVLNAAGDAVLQAARRMREEADAVERRLAGRDAELTGVVRLSCTEGLGARWLVPRLAAVRERLPGVDLELVVDNAAVNLSRREADVALRVQSAAESEAQPLAWQDALIARRVGDLGVGIYASESYLAARGVPATADELAGHDCVGIEMAGVSYIDAFDRLAKGARFVFRCNSLLAARAAVRAGWGIGVLSRFLADGEPGLRRLLPADTPPPLHLWILYHADLRGTARVRAVADLLAELIAADRQRLLGLD